MTSTYWLANISHSAYRKHHTTGDIKCFTNHKHHHTGWPLFLLPLAGIHHTYLWHDTIIPVAQHHHTGWPILLIPRAGKHHTTGMIKNQTNRITSAYWFANIPRSVCRNTSYDLYVKLTYSSHDVMRLV